MLEGRFPDAIAPGRARRGAAARRLAGLDAGRGCDHHGATRARTEVSQMPSAAPQALPALLLTAAPARLRLGRDDRRAERAEFRAEVRAYLLENPEILTRDGRAARGAASATAEPRDRDAGSPTQFRRDLRRRLLLRRRQPRGRASRSSSSSTTSAATAAGRIPEVVGPASPRTATSAGSSRRCRSSGPGSELRRPRRDRDADRRRAPRPMPRSTTG